eukprot:9189824-Heterocapsa_arctica.AAC.1
MPDSERMPKTFPQEAIRTPAELARESGLRTFVQTIAASWQSYKSGINNWGIFMDVYFPMTPHFPPPSDSSLA